MPEKSSRKKNFDQKQFEVPILFIVAMFLFRGFVRRECIFIGSADRRPYDAQVLTSDFSEFSILPIRRRYGSGVVFVMRLHEPDQVAAV